MSNTYEIILRPVALGGGWRLRLLENGVEVGGGLFPPVVDAFDDPAQALQAAFLDAEGEAYDWLNSRSE